MKTQLRTRSLRNLVVSAIVAASLNIAVSAQPNPDRSSTALSYAERIDRFMDVTEQSLRYVAPDGQLVEKETEAAMQNLDLFTQNVENILQYKAPVEFENQIDQELELLANNMMEQLEYHAPVYDEFTNTFAEKPVMSALKFNTRPVVAEDCTPQEAWLINAGYYKTSKKSVLHQVKNSKLTDINYADEL